MNKLSWKVIGFALVMSLFAPNGFAVGPDDIDYRQNVMKTLGENTAALFMILKQEAPKEDLANHVRALSITSTQILSAFKPKAKGGNAKPQVWEDWDDFAQRVNALAENLAELDKAVESGVWDADQIQEAFTCKGCHETYRVEK